MNKCSKQAAARKQTNNKQGRSRQASKNNTYLVDKNQKQPWQNNSTRYNYQLLESTKTDENEKIRGQDHGSKYVAVSALGLHTGNVVTSIFQNRDIRARAYEAHKVK